MNVLWQIGMAAVFVLLAVILVIVIRNERHR